MLDEGLLNWVWLIPAIPFVSFWTILFFGKRLGNRVTQSIGIGALGACFVLACITGVQWIDRAEDAADGSTVPVEVTTNGDEATYEGVVVRHEEAAEAESGTEDEGATQEEAAAEAEGEHEGSAGPVVTEWTWFTWGQTDFYVGTHLDGLAAMMLFVVAVVSLLVHIYSTEYLRDDRRFTHYYAFLSLFSASMLFYVLSASLLQMLLGWELVGLCSFVLIGHWWEDGNNSRAALKAFFT